MRRSERIGPLALLSLLALAWLACSAESPEKSTDDVVALLHGLGRTDLSMIRLEKALERSGYRVHNLGYPSTEHSIEHLAAQVLGPALSECCSESQGRIHFVTHSMGGIVLRYYLEGHELENLGRVVMLSPPNQGSELADWVAESPLLQNVIGPSVEQLGTGPESVPSQLGPVDFELGIITGDRTINPIFSHLIPGADDGKVSVESAKVSGMSDFLVMPHSHTFIMMREGVVEQVVHFLEHGRFNRDEAPGDSAEVG